MANDEHRLDSVAVVGHTSTSSLRGSSLGTLSWSMKGIQQMPQIMGNADPLHYLQMLPGIQTNSEHDAGLHIQGCDNGHNLLSIEGIPVYNPSHLLGLFSVFNPTHFNELELTKTAQSASFPNRLGGTINVKSLPITDSLQAVVTLGLISSQGTLQVPTGNHSSLTASFRTSYLNLLYGAWLKVDDTQLRYEFSDYNLTWKYRPSERDLITLTAYQGQDRATMDDEASSRLHWGNLLTGISWVHNFQNSAPPASYISQNLYYSYYSNTLKFQQTGRSLSLPASIRDLGYQAQFRLHHFTFGAECIYHDIAPQTPEYKETPNPKVQDIRNLEISLSTDYRLPLGSQFDLTLGLRFSTLVPTSSSGSSSSFLSPTIALSYQTAYGGIWGITYAQKVQYIQQTGFSDVGFPVEFWFSSNEHFKPQHSQNLTLSHLINLWDDSWQFTSELYAKRLYHPKEYVGNLMELYFDNDYQLAEQLRDGKGLNYGLSLLLNKRYGRGTLTFSYSVGRALRRFEGKDRTFPASHERIHELNAVGSLQIRPRLRLGGTFVLAGGTPFTAPRRFYMLNDRLISQYGNFNADRLPPYHRLDLSLSYDLEPFLIRSLSSPIAHSLNFSLYNAYAQRNCVTYRLKISKNNRFGLRKVCMFKFPLPSLSYTLKL